MRFKRSLCWMRRDLRLTDHRALFEATSSSDEVLIAFVFDSEILGRLSPDDRRLPLIFQALSALEQALRSKGSALIVLHGHPLEEIPRAVERLQIEAIFTNEDYEPEAKFRDQAVAAEITKRGRQFLSYKDQVVLSPTEVLKEDGRPYVKFTPYKNAWLQRTSKADLKPYQPDLSKLAQISATTPPLPRLETFGFQNRATETELTEASAQAVFTHFLKHIDSYKTQRDFPAQPGTSQLSMHLRFGTISIRALTRELTQRKAEGAQTWLSELIWREFYMMILDRFPEVTTQEFLPQYRGMPWPGKNQHFQAWCEGRTGYPIVDAGMRQLNQTGWMHNRLRMITASFLVKDLLIDWRKGERYFAKQLLDYDLAANNGGWQWCASTGNDAQPYFRIFNPVTQSQKFDPKGEFIRRFVPELKHLSDKDIHMPSTPPKGYPKPVVDHASQRIAATLLFQNARTRTPTPSPTPTSTQTATRAPIAQTHVED